MRAAGEYRPCSHGHAWEAVWADPYARSRGDAPVAITCNACDRTLAVKSSKET